MKIDDRLFTKKFFCDLSSCKGGCCTIKSDIGAPIKEYEIEIIDKNLECIKKYIAKENREIIDKSGFYTEIDGNYYLNNIMDEDCVFVYKDNHIARCSIQTAYDNGDINFKKPISCDLFPIRIVNDEMRFFIYNECDSAFLEGEKKGITVFEFLKNPIIRKFGESFYNKYKKLL